VLGRGTGWNTVSLSYPSSRFPVCCNGGEASANQSSVQKFSLFFPFMSLSGQAVWSPGEVGGEFTRNRLAFFFCAYAIITHGVWRAVISLLIFWVFPLPSPPSSTVGLCLWLRPCPSLPSFAGVCDCLLGEPSPRLLVVHLDLEESLRDTLEAQTFFR